MRMPRAVRYATIGVGPVTYYAAYALRRSMGDSVDRSMVIGTLAALAVMGIWMAALFIARDMHRNQQRSLHLAQMEQAAFEEREAKRREAAAARPVDRCNDPGGRMWGIAALCDRDAGHSGDHSFGMWGTRVVQSWPNYSRR